MIEDYLRSNDPMNPATVGPSGAPLFLASNESLGKPAPDAPMQTLAMNDPRAKPDLPMPSPKAMVAMGDDGDDEPAPKAVAKPVVQPIASAPLPASASSPDEDDSDDLSKYKVTQDDLDSAHSKRGLINALGAVGQGLSNIQGWGNFFTGHMNPHNDLTGTTKAMADATDDPINAKKLLMKQAVQAPIDAQKMQQAQNQSALDEEMNTPGSKMAMLNATTAQKVAQKIGVTLPSDLGNMSFAEQQEAINKNPILKTAFQEDANGKRLLFQANQAAVNNEFKDRRMALGQQSLDLRENKQASQAGQDVEHAVAPYKKTLNSIDRAESILNGKEPVTVKGLAIAQQDFINSVAAGGAATEGKVNREMIDTLGTELNALKLKFGDLEDIRKTDPQLVNHLRGMFSQVKADYTKAMQQQAADVQSSYSTNSSQKVQDTLKGKQDRYADPNQKPQAQMAPDDVDALNWAKQNKGTDKARMILGKLATKYPGAM